MNHDVLCFMGALFSGTGVSIGAGALVGYAIGHPPLDAKLSSLMGAFFGALTGIIGVCLGLGLMVVFNEHW